MFFPRTNDQPFRHFQRQWLDSRWSPLSGRFLTYNKLVSVIPYTSYPHQRGSGTIDADRLLHNILHQFLSTDTTTVCTIFQWSQSQSIADIVLTNKVVTTMIIRPLDDYTNCARSAVTNLGIWWWTVGTEKAITIVVSSGSWVFFLERGNQALHFVRTIACHLSSINEQNLIFNVIRSG